MSRLPPEGLRGLVLYPGYDAKCDENGSIIIFKKPDSEPLTTADLEEMETNPNP